MSSPLRISPVVDTSHNKTWLFDFLIYLFLQSKTLATSGFNSSWYLFDRRYGKSLLIFLTNAQRPFVFTAGGFMGLSLPSFAGILSKSYSYIALLRQIYGKWARQRYKRDKERDKFKQELQLQEYPLFGNQAWTNRPPSDWWSFNLNVNNKQKNVNIMWNNK